MKIFMVLCQQKNVVPIKINMLCNINSWKWFLSRIIFVVVVVVDSSCRAIMLSCRYSKPFFGNNKIVVWHSTFFGMLFNSAQFYC